jgi:Mrp family chromosome partitioning ATPase
LLTTLSKSTLIVVNRTRQGEDYAESVYPNISSQLSNSLLGINMLSIEFEPANQSEPCKCCRGLTTSLTRFVYNDGDAYAVYYAKFSNNHSERVVVATVSLGEWGEDSTPDQRVAFALELRSSENEYQVGLIDARFSPWQEAKTIGRTLNRDEALAHPLVKEAFHVTDHMVKDDVQIREYLNAQ